MQSVLNVRMDSTLKERGDKVLSEHGLSVSEAVRALWTLLATTRDVPEFLQESSEDEKQKRRKMATLEKLAAIGKASSSNDTHAESSNEGDQHLLSSMYDDMWKEYEQLT